MHTRIELFKAGEFVAQLPISVSDKKLPLIVSPPSLDASKERGYYLLDPSTDFTRSPQVREEGDNREHFARYDWVEITYLRGVAL